MSHLSLFELNALIKKTLEQQLEPTYWVVAEIGGLREDQKGHCYLELVEKEGNFISAKLRATIWAYTYRTLSGWFQSVTGTSLQAGLKVLLNVSVQFHEVYGLSLNVKDIDPNFTLGERARKRQEVIQQLIDLGVFDKNKGLPLPTVPQRIAIISSETAAGYEDFISHLSLNPRKFHFDTRLFASTMQGDQAPASIISSLEKIQSQSEAFDLIIIIRGGGAQLDLDCFDNLELAKKITESGLPVITGIGHERDETVADLVAHTKMKTPTAVADFLINGLEAFDDMLNESALRMYQGASQLVKDSFHQLSAVSAELRHQSAARIAESKNLLDRKSDILKYQTSHALRQNTDKVAFLAEQLANNSLAYLNNQNQRLANFESQFGLIAPEAILKRGFTISRVGKTLLKDATELEGKELTTIFHEGEVQSVIKNKKNDTGKDT